ncbi:MAG: zf-HC2 domain-containing protein [Acidobacteria bacterium]|nr:zf-HC2 domain-containing protein [Acidobacteriota bacterium]
MAHKQYNPADDFDLMLRRHLRQGGAPVAPCAGFDADTASAYVERALAAPGQLRFEKHLANCAACRRHIVALARLSDQLSPLPAASPAAPVQVAEPLWTRGRRAVAQWLDFSAWNSGWTAAAGVACAVLFAVLGAGVWWRAQAPQAGQAAKVAARLAETPAAMSDTAESTPPLSANSLNDAAKNAAANVAPTTPTTLNQPATNEPVVTTQPGTPLISLLKAESAAPARPAIPPPATTPNFPVTGNPAALTAHTSELRALAMEASAPTVAAPPVPAPAFNPPATAISFNHQNGNQPAGGVSPLHLGGVILPGEMGLQPSQPETKEMAKELLLPKPRRPRSGEALATKADAGKTASNNELLKALKGRSLGFMPLKGSDKEAKGIDARTKEADLKEAQEQPKLLMKRLNGHVFYFDHGFWIDEDYKSETSMTIKRLQRGSQEYQQILIQNPSLEQFFQLGQVIVVWKGVVYEVRK